MHTREDGLNTKKKKKYRGLIRMTQEFFGPAVLGLPEGVEVTDVYMDKREIVNVHLRSEEKQKETWETGEGMEFAQSANVEMLLYKKAIRMTRSIDSLEDGNYHKELYKQALAEVEAEEQEDE